MKKIKYLLITITFITCFNKVLFSQFDPFYYGFNNNFQSNLLNPSFKLEAKTVINVLANFNTHINLPYINLQNLFDKKISIDTTIKNIINNPNINFNNISQSLNWNLIYVGFTINKNSFISLGTQIKQNLAMSLPKDILGVTTIGNNYYTNVLNRPIQLNNLKFQTNAYLETHIGLTQTINDKIQFGVRLKYLSAFFHGSIDNKGFTLQSNLDSINIQGNFTGRVGGIYDIISGSNKNLLTNRKLFPGQGGGLDLGFNYKLNDNNIISASLLDLGFIRWDFQSGNYTSQNINYFFKGIELENFKISNSLFNSLRDTLKNVFKFSDEPLKFTEMLKPRFFLGWTYLISWQYKMDLVLNNDFNQTEFNPLIMGSFSQKIGSILDFRYSAFFFNKRLQSLGLGMNVNLGAFQLSLASSNILAPFFYDRSHFFNINIGSTLLFGRVQRGKKLNENLNVLQHLNL